MKQLQKLLTIVFIPLLLCGCYLNKQPSESEQSFSSVSSDISTESFNSVSSLNTALLNSYNLTSDDSLTGRYEPQKIRAHQHLLTEDMEGPYIFRTYQELASFSSDLKTEFYKEYGDSQVIGNYYKMIEYLDSINSSVFDDRIAILTPIYELLSGSLSHQFKGLYLKNETLYAYIMIDTFARYPAEAIFTTDIVWEAFMIFVDKDIEFSEVTILEDRLED